MNARDPGKTPAANSARPSVDEAGLSRRATIGYGLLLAAAVWSLLAVTGLAEAANPFQGSATTVHLDFPRAVGLYPGDSVHVQGIQSGVVEDVQPFADHVRVTIGVRDVPLDPRAVAAIRMRSLIGERFVEIGPVWSGSGPQLEDGTVLGGDRVRVPLELSEILEETGSLTEKIDEQAVRRLVKGFAAALGGKRDDVAGGLADLADLTAVLDARATKLEDGLAHLEGVVTTLAERDDEITTLLDSSAVVAESLLAQDGALERSIEGLDGLLGELAQFARTQRGSIATIAEQFGRVGPVLARHDKDFGKVVDLLPFVAYGYERVVQEDDGRWYVVNQPRGILFLPSGPPINTGPGSPAFRPYPRIYHEGGPVTDLTPNELDLSQATGPGPLLPSLRIGQDGVQCYEPGHEGDDERASSEECRRHRPGGDGS